MVIIYKYSCFMAVEKNILNNIDVEDIIDVVKNKSDLYFIRKKLCTYLHFFKI